MAAPVNPTNSQLSRTFYQICIDLVTICSNLSLPVDVDSSQTGVISGTTATTVVNCLAKQRDLY